MFKRILWLVAGVTFVIVILINARSLYEGIVFYLFEVITYQPAPLQLVDRTGRYASLYDLVRLPNQQRFEYIRHQLALSDVKVTIIPIPGTTSSELFASFNPTGPYLIYCAHYDKFSDAPDFQGATDNSSGVSILLAAIAEFARRGDGGNRAFLFTGEEETGLRGATTFVEFARANHLAIREIVDLNSFGRDQLALRPPAELPGYVFTLPLYGDIVYDGTQFRRSSPYQPVNARLAQVLQRIQPQMVVFQQFTSLSDSNVFQANGIDTVAVSSSNMYYLLLTWNTYADRVELVDERNLDLALDLILQYPGTQ